jgi:hypothetical protein
MNSTDQAIEEALVKAAAAARREYLRAALSMPVWRRGHLVWVEPVELVRYKADWSRSDTASTIRSSASGAA